jgi:hypothetical protein
MALDDNARSNAAPSTYGGPIYVYELLGTGIETGHGDQDSSLSRVLSTIGTRTTVLAIGTPGLGGAAFVDVVCEGGPDLSTTAGLWASIGTITGTETGGTHGNITITNTLTTARTGGGP